MLLLGMALQLYSLHQFGLCYIFYFPTSACLFYPLLTVGYVKPPAATVGHLVLPAILPVFPSYFLLVCYQVCNCSSCIETLNTQNLHLINFSDLNSILSDISTAMPYFYYYHGVSFSTLLIFLCLNLMCLLQMACCSVTCFYSFCQSPSFDWAA